MKKCKQCEIKFDPKDKRQKFCTRSCSATYNNLNGFIGAKKIGVDYGSCPGCGIKFKRRQKYCSFTCMADHKTRRWLAGEIFGSSEWCTVPDFIRDYLMENCGNQCSQCGWKEIHPLTNKTPLEIDHRDGDCTNNRFENLRVLCPNCHSLTENFRGLNSKIGRKRSQHQPIRDSKL